MVDRTKKAQLMERILGLKHKLRVNESGPTPQNHKEMAALAVANWDLEDEITVIEDYLGRTRTQNRKIKLASLIEELGDPEKASPEDSKPVKKAPSKK